MEKRSARLKATAAIALLLTLTAIATLAGRFALKYFETAKQGSALADVLMTANQRLPRTVDGRTRIDRVELGRRRAVMYHYTLVSYPARGQDWFEIYKTFGPLKASVAKRVCALALTRELLEADYSIVYRYKDKDGKKLFDVAVRRADCE